MELSKIREQSAKAAEQVCEAAKLKIGDLFVVGCSSSEILGEKIGTHSSVEGGQGKTCSILTTSRTVYVR